MHMLCFISTVVYRYIHTHIHTHTQKHTHTHTHTHTHIHTRKGSQHVSRHILTCHFFITRLKRVLHNLKKDLIIQPHVRKWRRENPECISLGANSGRLHTPKCHNRIFRYPRYSIGEYVYLLCNSICEYVYLLCIYTYASSREFIRVFVSVEQRIHICATPTNTHMNSYTYEFSARTESTHM